MPAHIARGNATRARVRSRVEHVFAAQKCRLGLAALRKALAMRRPAAGLILVVRTVGMVRVRVKIGLANLAYNFRPVRSWSSAGQPATGCTATWLFTRLAWLNGRAAPA
jgi:transposase, IS5 family